MSVSEMGDIRFPQLANYPVEMYRGHAQVVGKIGLGQRKCEVG